MRRRVTGTSRGAGSPRGAREVRTAAASSAGTGGPRFDDFGRGGRVRRRAGGAVEGKLVENLGDGGDGVFSVVPEGALAVGADVEFFVVVFVEEDLDAVGAFVGALDAGGDGQGAVFAALDFGGPDAAPVEIVEALVDGLAGEGVPAEGEDARALVHGASGVRAIRAF